MKTILWILGIIILIGFIFVIFNNKSESVRYGVNKNEVQLEHRTYYIDEVNDEIDYSTVLYTKDKNVSTNYSDFTISMDHLYETLTSRKGVYEAGDLVSVINFGYNLNSHDIKIVEDKVKISHKTLDGVILEPELIFNDVEHCYSSEYPKSACSYILKYSADTLEELPKKVLENIYIEFYIDGELVIIDKEFPIVKGDGFTGMDTIMGI
jgi:hypothetical protein